MGIFSFLGRRRMSRDFPVRHCIQVMPRETLRTIAEREYGDQEAWELIFKANRTQFKNDDPGNIRAGMQLAIPELKSRR